MSLTNINLSKLLKLLAAEGQELTSLLRSEIRTDIARENGDLSGGGDFYVPFWADARDHVCGFADLHTSTQGRIEANPRRSRLYPQLRDGFLLWWNERRRWTNEPFIEGDRVNGELFIAGLGLTIKVKGLLIVEDGLGEEHVVYPYFSEQPILSEEYARLALWVAQGALIDTPIDRVRILDVQRGQTYSIDRQPLIGNEEQSLAAQYLRLFARYQQLLDEYD